jgi:hypothetical protein
VAAALREDEGVDDRRVVMAMRDGSLVVGGSVPSPEEADRTLSIAKSAAEWAIRRPGPAHVHREGLRV